MFVCNTAGVHVCEGVLLSDSSDGTSLWHACLSLACVIWLKHPTVWAFNEELLTEWKTADVSSTSRSVGTHVTCLSFLYALENLSGNLWKNLNLICFVRRRWTVCSILPDFLFACFCLHACVQFCNSFSRVWCDLCVCLQVIAVVMDVFTDVDIFRDLLDAGFKRRISVYILLEHTTLPHFLSMCQRANMHAGHLKVSQSHPLDRFA